MPWLTAVGFLAATTDMAVMAALDQLPVEDTHHTQ
jgi:hypothetical protein